MGNYKLQFFDYDLASTLDCGQCFSFTLQEDGCWHGVALDRALSLRQDGNEIIFDGCSESEFQERFVHFFGMDDDYTEIKALLSEDPTLRTAIGYSPGIRIMHQPLWETALSFIVSQNNNIPRIKGILAKMRAAWGEHRDGYDIFPTAESLADLTEDDLAGLRCGYRAPYIIDCARKFTEGAIDENIIMRGPIDEARDELRKIKGVGPKVADCTLLFGAYRLEAFPVDVWMKKCLKAMYPDGIPDFVLPYAGIAQQYLFHYSRTSGIFD